jgi:hypothetical protein
MCSKIENVFKGKFEDTPEQNSSLVRLFLSSTTSGEFEYFKDFIFFYIRYIVSIKIFN